MTEKCSSLPHKCYASTGIHDALTFGSGELDVHGFWETPCGYHARLAEIRNSKSAGSYWPHTQEFIDAHFGELK